MNWAHSTLFINHPKFLERLGQTMIDNGVKPEIEVFDAGMYYNSLYYLKKVLIAPPPYYQFVHGAPGGTTATVENLVYLKRAFCRMASNGRRSGSVAATYRSSWQRWRWAATSVSGWRTTCSMPRTVSQNRMRSLLHGPCA